jgi:hypothetical protein
MVNKKLGEKKLESTQQIDTVVVAASPDAKAIPERIVSS